MAYLIIIRGPLGCGKSAVAKTIAGILRAVYISVDEVLAENGLDGIDPKTGCIPAGNFIKANAIMAPRARKSLDDGRIVIFDSCFYHKESIENLISSLSYRSFVFSLKAPLEVCIERDGNRPEPYGKSAVTDVYKLVSRFDYGTVIDISKPIKQAADELLSHLPKN